MFGGYTCRKCGCEIDLEGNVVSKRNHSSLPYVAGMMSLLLILAGIGCVLSMQLMQRSDVSSLAATPLQATSQVRSVDDKAESDASPVVDFVPEK